MRFNEVTNDYWEENLENVNLSIHSDSFIENSNKYCQNYETLFLPVYILLIRAESGIGSDKYFFSDEN